MNNAIPFDFNHAAIPVPRCVVCMCCCPAGKPGRCTAPTVGVRKTLHARKDEIWGRPSAIETSTPPETDWTAHARVGQTAMGVFATVDGPSIRMDSRAKGASNQRTTRPKRLVFVLAGLRIGGRARLGVVPGSLRHPPPTSGGFALGCQFRSERYRTMDRTRSPESGHALGAVTHAVGGQASNR